MLRILTLFSVFHKMASGAADTAPMARTEKIPFLKLNHRQLAFLAARAAGLDTSEACQRYKISIRTVDGWRADNEVFKQIETTMKDDPEWFHDNVANPLLLAASDMQDFEYLFELNGRQYKGMGGKARELRLMEMQKINAAPDPLKSAKDFFMSIGMVAPEPASLPAPQPIIDVLPVENERT